jgi:hypothetical protein
MFYLELTVEVLPVPRDPPPFYFKNPEGSLKIRGLTFKTNAAPFSFAYNLHKKAFKRTRKATIAQFGSKPISPIREL